MGRRSPLIDRSVVKVTQANQLFQLVHPINGGSECRKMTVADPKKFEVFNNRSLRIIRVFWPNKITNVELRKRTKTPIIEERVRSRRWRMIGHVHRKGNGEDYKVAVTSTPEGKQTDGNYNRVPTVLEKSLNFGFFLKSPWKWMSLNFRGPSLKFQLVVLDFLFCVFLTESLKGYSKSLKGYSKLRGTRSNFSPQKIRLSSLAAAYKLNIFPVPLAHV